MILGFAQPSDEASIHALLKASNLPTSDLTDKHLQHFLVMRDDDAIVGVAGVERLGKRSGLVRSIAVAPQFRGKGIAVKLYTAIEEHACSMGIHEVFALTTTIADWLSRLGYERLSREDAPKEVRQTKQFGGLCSTSAVIMRKTLQVPSEKIPGTFECA